MFFIHLFVDSANKNALSIYYLPDRVHSLEGGGKIARQMTTRQKGQSVTGKDTLWGIVWA